MPYSILVEGRLISDHPMENKPPLPCSETWIQKMPEDYSLGTGHFRVLVSIKA